MSTHIATKNKTRNGNIELFEIELTKAQIKAFSNILPKGFSFQPVPKKKQDLTPQPTKKLFTNDGNQVVKKVTKPAVIPHEDILINKNALRDPTKRKLSTHFEYKYPDFEAIPTTSSKSSRPNNDALRKCYSLLQKLKKHHSAGPFIFPVDVEGLGLTDYYDVVHEPMDLSTVENKLKNGQYLSANQFAADVRKIWNNAFLYNMNGSVIYTMTIEMSSHFEKLFREIEHVGFNDPVRDLEKKVEMLSKQITELHQRGISNVPEPPKMARSGSKASKTAKLMEKPLTIQEKKVLGQNIKKLPPEHLRGVWDIVSQRMDLSNNNQEELEFDIENLPVNVARELERFVKHKMSLLNRSKNKNKAKELSVPRAIQPTFNNLKQQETEFEPITNKGEDEVTTQHHSVMGSDGKPDSKGDLNAKEDNSPSNSSESSFISDSDSDGEDESKDTNRIKASKSLQTKQELANFLAGSHGSMLNSFIVK